MSARTAGRQGVSLWTPIGFVGIPRGKVGPRWGAGSGGGRGRGERGARGCGCPRASVAGGRRSAARGLQCPQPAGPAQDGTRPQVPEPRRAAPLRARLAPLPPC